jgi:outer membrane protein W
MKKYILLVFVAGFSIGASAQRFSLGPNAGVGATWIDNYDDKMGKTHGNVGVSLIYSAIDNFGIGVDLKYSFEGGKREYTTSIPLAGGDFKTVDEANLNYLRVPVKAMFFFGKYGNKLRPKVAVGPSFGFLMGGKLKTETTGPSGAVTNTTEVETKDHFESFDFGLHGSAGINYRLVERVWFVADVVYNHGLSDIVKDNTSNIKYHNRNVGVNIGVNFGL